MRVLILYTELAGYVVGNINRFLQANPESEILLVHYKVNDEAPFVFKMGENATLIEYDRSREASIEKEIGSFDPQIVLCSGWSNKFYLQQVRALGKSVKKVICFDNKWKGTLKQQILRMISRFSVLRYFKYAWVPGNPQREYALRLGFKSQNIHTGLYPADTNFFMQLGRKKLENKDTYPKIILSVARYIPQKDLPTLWKAFISANERTGNEWQLNCVGLGELFEQRILDPHIQHLGFKQPHELESYILEAGVFVLPSTEEPWGVVVHEMALSALPMVLSDKVGASTMFLDRSNGYSYPAGDVKELEDRLLKIMHLEDSELRKMAEHSYFLGKQLLSEDWSKTLLEILNSK